MKSPCLKPLVYRTLYPSPMEGDPTSFSDFINRCIVPEVRTETARFYGPIDDVEAKYPGLDYCSSAHRLRLRQFPHHCRLFDAFDRLGLTYAEVYELCRWEGTKNAKDKYMKHNNVVIHDTTWDGIKADNRPRLPPTSEPGRRQPIAQPMQLDGTSESPPRVRSRRSPHTSEFAQARTPTLNRRVRAVTAAHLREQTMHLDPEYEQWMKDTAGYGVTPLSDFPPLFPPASASPFSSHRSQARLQAPAADSEYLPPTSFFPYQQSNYASRDYWTHSVPEMHQRSRGSSRSPTSNYPYVIESARRMMGAPISPAYSIPSGTSRPNWTVAGGAAPEPRRSRRR